MVVFTSTDTQVVLSHWQSISTSLRASRVSALSLTNRSPAASCWRTCFCWIPQLVNSSPLPCNMFQCPLQALVGAAASSPAAKCPHHKEAGRLSLLQHRAFCPWSYVPEPHVLRCGVLDTPPTPTPEHRARLLSSALNTQHVSLREDDLVFLRDSKEDSPRHCQGHNNHNLFFPCDISAPDQFLSNPFSPLLHTTVTVSLITSSRAQGILLSISPLSSSATNAQFYLQTG